MARYVTVGSISQHPGRWPAKASLSDHEARHQETVTLLERAVRLGAQVVAFPETYPQIGIPGSPRDRAEALDGPSLTRMAETTHRLGVYVIWPLNTLEDDKVYNSAVLLGPEGDIIGVYHKMFPTIGEIEEGVTPGASPGVFETEFGRFGLTICFDLNFHEVMRATAEVGAEVIFFSSYYRGGLQLQSWAYEFGVYLVSSIPGELGCIVDQTGKVLAESTYESIITRRINLDRIVMHMDGNWDKMDAMLAKYGSQLSIDFITREGCWAIGSESDQFTIADIVREFELEPRDRYYQRARAVRQRALEQDS
jgi:predicted amidohydrolase